MRIRDTTIDDMAAIQKIRSEASAWDAIPVEALRVWFNADPPEARRLQICATEPDGGLVGYGEVSLNLDVSGGTTATQGLLVATAARGNGVGSALNDRLDQHLREIGATRVQTWVDEESTAFAEHRGFELGATDLFVVVDPRDLPPAPPFGPGVTIQAVRETGPDPLYHVTDTAARDEPGDVPFEGMEYGRWLALYWPTIDHDLSMIAYVDGEPAACTMLRATYDNGRAESAGTDCLREFRGRGLAKLLKAVSLRAAAERGITAAYTSNDETNAPIRAINAWLGYQPVGVRRSALRSLPE
jgi:GNAT superfamily N-acetyltransferase